MSDCSLLATTQDGVLVLPVEIPLPRETRNYTAHAHPALCVPCPECGKAVGSTCVRAGGRKAPTMHVARRKLVMLLFVIDYGDSARLTQRGARWVVERQSLVFD